MVQSFPTGQVARRQIEIFKAEGVNLTRVKIDHSNDTTDTEYLEMGPRSRLLSRLGSLSRSPGQSTNENSYT